MEKEKNIQENATKKIEDKPQPSEINFIAYEGDEIKVIMMFPELLERGLLTTVNMLTKYAKEPIRVEIDIRNKPMQIRVYASEQGCLRMEEMIASYNNGLKALPTWYGGKRCSELIVKEQDKTLS